MDRPVVASSVTAIRILALRILAPLSGGALAMMAWSEPAAATVVQALSIEQMVREADAVVHGVVTRSGSRLSLDQTRVDVVTVTTVHVHRWFKGPGGSDITIRQPGGEWEDYRSEIEGTPTFTKHDEVVLFLERLPAGEFRTLGLAQGCFRVQRSGSGAVVDRDLSSLTLTRQRQRAAAEKRAARSPHPQKRADPRNAIRLNRTPLHELLDVIARVAQDQRRPPHEATP